MPLRLAVVQALFADGDLEGGRQALRDALAQVELRADDIQDFDMRQSYLNLLENRQLYALAR